MSIYEQWINKAFSQEGKSKEEVWNDYLPKEQKIYEDILTNKTTEIKGTVAEIAEQFSFTAEYAVAFIDGINDILEPPYDVNSLEESSEVTITIDFEKLYKKMVEYKAEHLYTLPQWNEIFDEDQQRALFVAQRKSRTITNDLKIGRNEPCPCGSGKKYKKCCGA